MKDYSYTREDFSVPINYSYAIYGGAAFIEGYFSFRENKLKELNAHLEERLTRKPLEIKPPHLTEFVVFADALSPLNNRKWLDVKSLSGAFAKPSGVRLHDLCLRYISAMEQEESVPVTKPLRVSVTEEDGFDTQEILKLILLARTAVSLVEVVEADEVIDRLTRKYDYYQRISTHYDKSYKKKTDDFQDLSTYAPLAILCAEIYLRKNNLRFLNTLLKINDYLSSVDVGKLNEVESLMIITSLYAEIGIIRGLRERL